MHGSTKLSDRELAEIRRRRPAVRASLACEGMYLTPAEEALFEQMDRDRLLAEDRVRLVISQSRARRAKAQAAE